MGWRDGVVDGVVDEVVDEVDGDGKGGRGKRNW